jgi:hypothetical protein
VDGQRDAARENQPKNVTAIGAERQPHANLALTLRHQVRHHTEQTNRRQHQRDRREKAKQIQIEPPRSK